MLTYITLPSTLCIMWTIHLQSSKLLRVRFRKRYVYKKNTLFDLDIGVKVTQNVAKFEVATSNSLRGDAFTKKKHYLTFEHDLVDLEMLPSTNFIMWSMQVQSWSCYTQQKIHSRTPDRDFCCFYPCEIILSHILVQDLGKDKKRTAARRPDAGRRSIRDVIVILKWRQHVASQRIQDFLEAFLCISNIKWDI